MRILWGVMAEMWNPRPASGASQVNIKVCTTLSWTPLHHSSLSSDFCAGSTTLLSERQLGQKRPQESRPRQRKCRGFSSWHAKLQPVWTELCKTWHRWISLRPTKALGASRPYFMRDPAKEEGNVCRRSPLPDVFRIWSLPQALQERL